MRYLKAVAVGLALGVFTFVGRADASCPFATVHVQGTVINLPADADKLTVTASFSPKRHDLSRAVPVSDGAFTLDMPFHMQRSWSPFFGDRCTFVPQTMELTVQIGERVLLRTSVRFKDAFERTSQFDWRPKRAVRLELR